MTLEERRLRPEHHVVHDYANLLSSGLLRSEKYVALLLNIPTANSHAWHAFYMNCRKTYEFFHHQKSKEHFRAQQFVKPGVTFRFQHWTADVQKFMNTHTLHYGGGRVANNTVWTGADDQKYLDEFKGFWEMMLRNLKDKHKPIFLDEIDFRLTEPEFQFCGSLGKEFIL